MRKIIERTHQEGADIYTLTGPETQTSGSRVSNVYKIVAYEQYKFSSRARGMCQSM